MLSRRLSPTLAVVSLLGLTAPASLGQVWTGPTGAGESGSWNAAANWTPNTVPNAVGAAVTFNAPTTARVVTVDSGAAGFTVGSISFTMGPVTDALQVGTAGSNLKLDNGGNGVTLTFNASGTTLGNNTISAATVFNDNVTANVNYQPTTPSGSVTQGALNWTGSASGSFGFTKTGPGKMTMGTALKAYTGPTLFDTDSGRIRISTAGRPSATSSLTVKQGAQIDLITASLGYTFGPGPLNLNGTGLGPASLEGNFPGAIRQDTGLVTGITNNTVLQTDTLLHVQATAGTGSGSNPTGSMTMSGVISGPGKLTVTAPNSNVDQGFLILSNANTYTGGTLVAGGILQVTGGTAAAPGLGTGNVSVTNASSPSSIARLSIPNAGVDAISDAAILSLDGGNSGFAILGAGVNETVGGLILGGTVEPAGTYGSTASGATFQSDTFFSGTGIITVAGVPEPSTLALTGLAAAGFVGRRLRRKPAVA
jgi:autotransporter-associated beta strand protein